MSQYAQFFEKYQSSGLSKTEFFNQHLSDDSQCTYNGFRSAMQRMEQKQAFQEVLDEQEGIVRAPSVSQEIQQLLNHNKQVLYNKVNERLKSKDVVHLIVRSDEHYPYHDPEVVELLNKCLQMVDVDFMTTVSDEMDHRLISRHKDVMSADEIRFESDPENIFKVHKSVLDSAPSNVISIPTIGNHDARWISDAKKSKDNSRLEHIGSDLLIKWWINNYTDLGTPIWTLSQHEQFHFGDSLSLWHGSWASSNPQSNTIKHIEATQPTMYNSESNYRSVSFGHDHRAGLFIKGRRVGYSNPCLCLPNQPYMGGKNPIWQHGFTHIMYHNKSGMEWGYPVLFKKVLGKWSTIFQDQFVTV